MDGFKAFMIVLAFLVVVISPVILIGLIIRFARRNEKPSEFVSGIVYSMLRTPTNWDYTNDEAWLISDHAMLSISLQDGNFGRVITRQHVNIGSTFIMNLEGKDLRAFRRALSEWRDKTAIEHQHRIERWKRDAMAAMA